MGPVVDNMLVTIPATVGHQSRGDIRHGRTTGTQDDSTSHKAANRLLSHTLIFIVNCFKM